MAQRREPVFGLDVVRLIAALLVTAYHLAFKPFARADTPLAAVTTTGFLPPWHMWCWWGWIGVQIFFVISGTVIAYSLAGATPLAFFRKRVERLYPALLVCGTIALPVAILILGTPPGTALSLWARTMLFVPVAPWLLGQFWTLPLEAVFYGYMWLLLVMGRERYLPHCAWGLALASAACWLLYATGVHPPGAQIIRLLLFQHGCYFALGIYLAAPERFGAGPARLLFLTIVIAAAAAQIRAAAGGEELGYGLERLWLGPFLVWLVAVAAIGASVRWRRPIAVRVAHHGPLLAAMGRLTYPLYLIHMESGVPVLLLSLHAGIAPLVAIAAAIATSVAAGLAVALWLEPPLHRLVAAVLRGGFARRALTPPPRA